MVLRVCIHACKYVCVCARVHVGACAHVRGRVCARACACVRTCEERDKHPFQDNAISLLSAYLIYMLELTFF